MKVLLDVEFDVITGAVAPDIVEKWEKTTISNAVLADNRRKSKIKGYNDYESLIVDGSTKSFGDYINPDFTSKAGLNKQEIISKRYKNMLDGYKKYADKMTYLYETVDGEPAKRYIERIKRSGGNYGKNVAKKLLAFTGTRVGGIGCAVLAMKWLDGDAAFAGQAFVSMKKGSALIIARPGLRSAFRATLIQRLIQAGATIVRGEFQEGVTKRQNDITNALMNAIVNPALNLAEFETGGDSHVDFANESADGGFRISVKVSQK